MDTLARRTDPLSSHAAAREIEASGARQTQQVELARLVENNPGMTYRQLWREHIADCRRRGVDYVFQDPVSIMPRLNDVAKHGDSVRCPVSGRTAVTWWPK